VTETTQLAQELIGPAAIAPITDRAFLRITGPDATRWLNGMVTNNIKDLQPGEGNYNFLLNAQGRIQGDCTIYREPNDGPVTFLLETDISQLETVHQTLDRFIIMDDVELSTSLNIHGKTVEPSMLEGIALTGPTAAGLFSKVMMETAHEFLLIDAPAPGSMVWGTYERQAPSFILTPPNKPSTFEIWSWHLDLEAIRKHFVKLGASEASPETLESLRILEATPKYGIDIRDRDLPQETAQTHALHFAKGCYLGQEIVERIRSRGQVHRTFTQFTLTGELPTLPAPLLSNEKPAGELTSAARIGDKIFALGYIRREILETHQPVTYPGGTAVPRT
jgi:folate-binding protein YgfZ